ncbi:MAG: hypothetical protein C4523_07370, partial [Myxococcales bacterium]
MKHNDKSVIEACLLLAAMILAACAGGNPANPSNGDEDLPGPTYDTGVDCIETADCGAFEECSTEGTCLAYECRQTSECEAISPLCYCQGETYCVCPEPPDGDKPDGDDGEDATDGDDGGVVGLCPRPSVVDFGAVQFNSRAEKTLELENCGERPIVLNGVQINPVDQEGHPSDVSEFDAIGDK